MSSSSLRGRTRNSGWQWLIIGVVFGLGCGSIACLGSYALGLIRLNVPGQLVAAQPTPTVGPTNTPFIITATPAPTNTPLPITDTPQIANTALPAPSQPAQVLPASATPYIVINTPSDASPNGTAALPTFPPVGTSLVPATATPVPTISTIVTTPSSGVTLAAPSNGGVIASLSPTELVTINGGTFKMGTTTKEAAQAVDDCTNRDKGLCQISYTSDSQPEHDVTLNTYQIEKYTVTFEQYLAFLNSLSESYKTACGGQQCVAIQDAQSKASPIKFDGVAYQVTPVFLKNPVTFVTWYGANAYCKAIGRRLPTEAEWERGARYTDKRLYPWGSSWDPANANTSRPTPGKGFTQPVGSYPTGASPEGLYEMVGNASQWVADWYDANYYKSTDQTHWLNPKGPPTGTEKVYRGGEWDEVPFFARAVNRQSAAPDSSRSGTGFRCAADAGANGSNGGASSGNSSANATSPAAVKPTLAP
jgi:formylglycine-generating enzyme required for sulfatase activity